LRGKVGSTLCGEGGYWKKKNLSNTRWKDRYDKKIDDDGKNPRLSYRDHKKVKLNTKGLKIRESSKEFRYFRV